MITVPAEDVGSMLRREREGRLSDEYLAQQRARHLLEPAGTGSRWTNAVLWLCGQYGCGSVLDYGCGDSVLKAALHERDRLIAVREYDPAIDGKDGRPSFADLVVCADVLPHVQPEHVGAVLKHIHGLARKAILFVVSASERSAAWWDAKIDEEGWEIVDSPDLPLPADVSPHWIAVVRPRR